MEMNEYRSEEIHAETLAFTDNQSLLVHRFLFVLSWSIDVRVFKDLFMARPLGILSLLDDESRLPKVRRARRERFSKRRRKCFSGDRSNVSGEVQLSFRFEQTRMLFDQSQQKTFVYHSSLCWQSFLLCLGLLGEESWHPFRQRRWHVPRERRWFDSSAVPWKSVRRNDQHEQRRPSASTSNGSGKRRSKSADGWRAVSGKDARSEFETNVVSFSALVTNSDGSNVLVTSGFHALSQTESTEKGSNFRRNIRSRSGKTSRVEASRIDCRCL